MQGGKYFNVKYAVRRKKLRRAILCTAVLTLLIIGVGTLWQVDYTIRGTMLPAAPPISEIERIKPQNYSISLFGHKFDLSFSDMYAACDELSELVRTPPSSVRLFYQLRAYFTDELPKNLRDNPRKASAL